MYFAARDIYELGVTSGAFDLHKSAVNCAHDNLLLIMVCDLGSMIVQLIASHHHQNSLGLT